MRLIRSCSSTVDHHASDAELDAAMENGGVIALQPGQTVQTVLLLTSDPRSDARVAATSSFASPGTGNVLVSAHEKTLTVLEQVCGAVSTALSLFLKPRSCQVGSPIPCSAEDVSGETIYDESFPAMCLREWLQVAPVNAIRRGSYKLAVNFLYCNESQRFWPGGSLNDLDCSCASHAVQTAFTSMWGSRHPMVRRSTSR